MPVLAPGQMPSGETFYLLIDERTGNPWRGPVALTEAAMALEVTPATLRQQIANGKLRATKRGRDWWVTAREVARYRAESRRGYSP